MQLEYDILEEEDLPVEAALGASKTGRWTALLAGYHGALRRAVARHTGVAKVAIHLLLVPVAYYLAFAVRFDFVVPPQYAALLLRTLPIVVAARLLALGFFRINKGWWRYVGVPDLVAFIKATTVSSLVVAVLFFFTDQLRSFPRSVLFLDWVFALLLIGAARLLVRVSLRENTLRLFGGRRPNRTNVLVIGAGDAGEHLIRELLRERAANLVPVALIDDNPAKVGMSIHGVRVRGTSHDLARVAHRYNVQTAIIAAPSATAERMQHLVRECGKAGLQCRIVPSLPELLNGTARLSQVREVSIDDLLGRNSVELDLSLARGAIAGKVVLITGGAGSIGSELARQVAALGPSRLVLVERAESPLYFIDLELKKAFRGVDVVPVIADVRDRGRVGEIFATYRPHYIFHAAAFKHVPLMEHHVVEAVRNNVLGTLCVAEAAARYGAERFVLISTDKAVRPSSVMGATKRIAERIVLGWPTLVASSTDFRAVRFGNVLGSNGSVVPLFKGQLAAGGPLTVTHPEVTRYFMTIPEASQLVLMAATLPEARRRIAMLEMGEPVKIKDLAESLIRLSGLEPGADIGITYTGLRPGEKLYEELMSAVEATVPTHVSKVRLIQAVEPGGEDLKAAMAKLTAALDTGHREEVLAVIVETIPECVSPLRERGKRPQGEDSDGAAVRAGTAHGTPHTTRAAVPLAW